MKEPTKSFYVEGICVGFLLATIIASFIIFGLSFWYSQVVIKNLKIQLEDAKSGMNKPANVDTVKSCLEKLGFTYDEDDGALIYKGTFRATNLSTTGLQVSKELYSEPLVQVFISDIYDKNLKVDPSLPGKGYIGIRNGGDGVSWQGIDKDELDKLDRVKNIPFTWEDDDPNVYLKNKRLNILSSNKSGDSEWIELESGACEGCKTSITIHDKSGDVELTGKGLDK